MHHPTERITHTTAFVTPVVEHWLERVQEPEMTLDGVNYVRPIIAEQTDTSPYTPPHFLPYTGPPFLPPAPHNFF